MFNILKIKLLLAQPPLKRSGYAHLALRIFFQVPFTG
jgi:hypothetical protein